MYIVFVFRELAQFVGLVILVRADINQRQIVVKTTERGNYAHEVPSFIAQVVGAAVALAVLILVLVRELQISAESNGLAIGQTDAVVPVLGRCHRITVILYIVNRDRNGSIVFYQFVRERLAQTFAIVCAQTQSNVSTIVAKSAINLTPASYAFVIAVAQITVAITILNDAIALFVFLINKLRELT